VFIEESNTETFGPRGLRVLSPRFVALQFVSRFGRLLDSIDSGYGCIAGDRVRFLDWAMKGQMLMLRRYH